MYTRDALLVRFIDRLDALASEMTHEVELVDAVVSLPDVIALRGVIRWTCVALRYARSLLGGSVQHSFGPKDPSDVGHEAKRAIGVVR